MKCINLTAVCSLIIVVMTLLIFNMDTAESQNACYQGADTGPCRASIPRFYYNARSGRCDTFNWGGCEGNQNNFRSINECHSFRRYCLRRRGFS